MKLLKLTGIIFLFGAGFFAHTLLTSSLPLRAKLYLGILIALILHIGIAATLAKDGKSFKESFLEAMAWPFNLLP